MVYKHEGRELHCRSCGEPLREDEMTIHFLCRACIRDMARAEEHLAGPGPTTPAHQDPTPTTVTN